MVGPLPTLELGRDLDPRLHPYQVRAVRHLWAHPRACLFMEMGLGKTATVLQALTPDHGRVLVVAPKRVAEKVWPAEVGTWRPDLTVAVSTGSIPKAKRLATLEHSDADIVVMGRDNLGDLTEKSVRRFTTVVLDELSSFKNRSTQRWRAAMKVCRRACYVWGLTGTPSPNGYMDLWAELALVDLGQRLGQSITRYRAQFFTPSGYVAGGVVTDYELRPGAQAAIDERLADVVVSMRSQDYLDLPPTVSTRVEVQLPATARRVYDELKRDLVANLTEDGDEVVAASAAVATGKLSQVTAGFLYLDEILEGGARAVEDLHPVKIDALLEVLDEAEGGVLVFYHFRHELARLREALPGARTVDDPGALEAWNAGELPVLLAHPASAGHGLNLQRGGHTIVWTTPTWSLELYQQANARLARQGQTRPVMIHHLVVPGSVDAAALDALEGKASVQDALMDALGII